MNEDDMTPEHERKDNEETQVPATQQVVGCIDRAWIGYDNSRSAFGLFIALRQRAQEIGTVAQASHPIEVAPAEDADWSEETRDTMFAGAVRQANGLLRITGRQTVDELAGVPVQVEIDADGQIRDWRVLLEAL